MTLAGRGESNAVLVTAAALLDVDGRVLIGQRPADKQHGGLWEFPGGKVEAGETPDQALARELREELGVDPCPGCLEPFAFATRAESGLVLLLYACRRWDGVVEAREHAAIAWVARIRLLDYDLAPADRELASAVMDRLDGVRVMA